MGLVNKIICFFTNHDYSGDTLFKNGCYYCVCHKCGKIIYLSPIPEMPKLTHEDKK